jgi:cytochrome c biogenesis protein
MARVAGSDPAAVEPAAPDAAPGADTAAPAPPGVPEPQDPPLAPPPALSPRELARWAWRQLTSMRTALLLLFLLALGAVPGSVVPQRETNPLAAAAWAERNPALVPWAERLGLFDVYSSPWFSAIYLLLVVSLIGCVVPRARVHWRAVRARPPAPPRVLSRLPASRVFEVAEPPDEVLRRAERLLRRYRVDRHADVGFGAGLAAERGHLRETGNLLFHLAFVVVLAAVAVGSLFGYRASVLVVTGGGFANSPIQYDSLQAGSWFEPGDLPPFTLTLDEFLLDFRDDGPEAGAPADFRAEVTVVERPGAPPRRDTIEVNRPLDLAGTSVHVLNPGYAPHITVRDAAGEVLFSQAVPFLPQDEDFASVGVVKVQVPDGRDLGLQAFFLPTAVPDEAGRLGSAFPEPRNPALVLRAFRGDLGLDDGVPQSVFRLDTGQLTELRQDGRPFSAALGVGQTAQLPDGAGTVTFDGVATWVNLQVSRDVGTGVALAGAGLAIAGLLASLYVRRRRVWVRAMAVGPGRTVVEVAGLDRAEGGDLDEEIDAIAQALRDAGSVRAEPDPVAAE